MMNWLVHYSTMRKKVPTHSLEAVSLYLAIFFMPMKRGASFGWIGLPWEITFFKIFLILTFIVWIAKILFTKTSRLFISPFKGALNVAIILYLLASILSIFNATDPNLAIPALIRRATVIGFYFLMMNIIQEKKLFQFVIVAFLLGTAIESSVGIYELISNEPVLKIEDVYQETVRTEGGLFQEKGKFRIQGFALDPDWHAYIMIIGICFALGVIFSKYINMSWLRRVLFILILVSLIINVFGAASRAGWIGLLISFGIFLLFVPIRRKGLLIIGLFFLLGTLFLGIAFTSNTPILERLLGKTGHISTSLRGDEARLSLAMFRAHPILGIGLGNTPNVKYRYSRVAPVCLRTKDLSVCGYLMLLSENGLLGFISYSFILYFFMVRIINTFTSAHDPEKKKLVLGVLSSFLSFLFLMAFYPIVDSEFFWFSVGVCYVLTHIAEEKVETKIRYFSPTWVIPYPKSKNSTR
ncbi:MAG: O-antigen ligase family protein [Candidatus Brocadiaceae bacterium]|nr:O-antigen ligase family protein [Candidatus Brocadiaceae bacterium]